MNNLSVEEQKKVDELAAYLFEPSADVQMCSDLIRGVILRMRERRTEAA